MHSRSSSGSIANRWFGREWVLLGRALKLRRLVGSNRIVFVSEVRAVCGIIKKAECWARKPGVQGGSEAGERSACRRDLFGLIVLRRPCLLHARDSGLHRSAALIAHCCLTIQCRQRGKIACDQAWRVRRRLVQAARPTKPKAARAILDGSGTAVHPSSEVKE